MIEEFEDSVDLYDDENVEPLTFDIKEDLESSETLLKISSYITHEACRLYYTNFRKNLLPSTFVEFIFNEYKKYSYPSSKLLQEYFEEYKDSNIELIVDSYSDNFFSVIVKKIKKYNQTYYKMIQNVYSSISVSQSNFIDFEDKEVLTSLNNATKHILESDELLSMKELYDNYIMEKELKSIDNQHLLNKASGYKPEIPEQSELDSFLVGESTDIPNQKGKVVKVFFPKLSLPSPYPMTTQEKSRINSDHRASKFVKIDKQIVIMNKHKINGVKYKQGFIEKRKVAQKPPRRKFDFDF